MSAVVPCQWRRIIGSSETLTSPVLKKLFNRSKSRHHAHFTCYLLVICATSRAKLATCFQSV
ncbi:hypothetical protein CWM52_21785 [Raoultella sp. T31]|nr:hypothetical protein CWM52_21785 [Raoultella sp. T31]